MTACMRALALVTGLLCFGVASAAAGLSPARQDIQLPPELMDLLRAEMREITAGAQSMVVALVTGDWQSIAKTSNRIRDSYIMLQQLTPDQVEMLEQTLPEQFKQLDLEFHRRAERLGAAAMAHDAERVANELSRLLETCASCHTAFAKSRFPGFPSPAGHQGHHRTQPTEPSVGSERHEAEGQPMEIADVRDFMDAFGVSD